MKFIVRYSLYFSVFLLFNSIAYSQAPVVTSFTPTSGIPGILVTIIGANFDSTPTNNLVLFGSVRAIVTTASATQLTVTVPSGALHASVSVLNVTNGLTGVSSKLFLPTYNGCGNLSTRFLSDKIADGSGLIMYDLVSSDMDGDGKMDLFALYDGSYSAVIMRNVSQPGCPAFVFNPMFSIGAGPFSRIISGDLTGDGRPEIAAVLSSSGTINISQNNSTPASISFGSVVPFSSSVSFPAHATIGDVDGDGKNDIVVIGNGPTVRFSVLRNTTTGGVLSFAPPVVVNTTATNGRGILLTDLDGDGKKDITIYGTSLFVFRNTSTHGSISVSAGQTWAVHAEIHGIAVGDIDGDGKTDVVSASSNSSTVSIFRNSSVSGSISFNPRTDYATAISSFNISLADMDGDQKSDLVTLNGENTSVLKNNSTPGALSIASNVIHPSGGYGLGLVVADVDYDNQPDVVTHNSGGIAVYRNIAGCVPPIITSFSPASAPLGATVTISGSNFNNTAANNAVSFGHVRTTVITATPTQLTVTVPPGALSHRISVTDVTSRLTAYSTLPFQQTFTCNGALSFAGTSGNPVADRYMIFKDFDGDGKPDMAATKSNNTLEVFRNTSIELISFATPTIFPIPLYSEEGLFSEDLNGDGKPDLVTHNSMSMAYHKNTSTLGVLSFATPQTLEKRVDINSYVDNLQGLHDFDGDGKSDLLDYKSAFGHRYTILKNISTGDVLSFQETTLIPVTYTPNKTVHVTDLDNDGKLDLLIQYGSNFIHFYRNTTLVGGTINFAPKIDIPTIFQATTIKTRDIDGDGKNDILYLNFLQNKLVILRNTTSSSTVSFAPHQEFLSPWQTRNLDFQDLNGDGKPDISIATAIDNKVCIFKNTSMPGNVSFEPRFDLSVSNNPTEVFGVDLNIDGKADIVIQHSYGSGLSIYRNTNTNITGVAVAADQIICTNGDPAAFTQTTASTDPGTLTYQWQSSSDNIMYSDISGATGTTYNAPAGITQTTYYKRLTFATQNGVTCSADSNPITITVTPISGGQVAGDQSFCTSGNPAMLTQVTPASGPGALSYQWKQSTNGTTYANAGGASTGATYDPSSITQTTHYKRFVTSSLGCSAESNPITITIVNVSMPTISQTGSVCDQYVTLRAYASGATSYVWSTGNASQTVNMLSSGTYTVTATYGNGCSRTSSSFSATIPACNPDPCDDPLARSRPPCDTPPPVEASSELIVTQTTAYPNPADGSIVVHIPAPAETDLSVKMYSHFGQELRAATLVKGTRKIVFDTNELANGMYIVQIQPGPTFKSFSRKVMVVHHP